MSTSVYAGVRSTLRQIIENMPELSTVEKAWEGRKYTPTIDKAYIQEQMIPVDSPVETLGTNGLVREDFIYQLNLFWPANEGLFEHEDVVDAVRAAFHPGFQIRSASDQFKNGIVTESSRTQAIVEDDFRMIPIIISAYVYRPIKLS